MESRRRLYFKKQIVREFSEQKTKVPTSRENLNSKNNEADEDWDVTLLGSQSYYDQIQRFPFVNMIPSNPDNSNTEKESQDDHDSTTKALLEDITNKDITKEKNYTENIEDIRIDNEFESTENTKEFGIRKTRVIYFHKKKTMMTNGYLKMKKITKKKNLNYTLTEVIAESKMELLRKSFEADEDDIEAENNNDNQVKSKKGNKRNKTTNEKMTKKMNLNIFLH